MTLRPVQSPLDPLAALQLLRGSGGGREFESLIAGGSMGRTLPAGTRIVISCSGAAGCRAGDVIAFLRDGRLVAHRLLGRGRGARGRQWLVTRGDATLICDAPVAADMVLGVVSGSMSGIEGGPGSMSGIEGGPGSIPGIEGGAEPVPAAPVRRGVRAGLARAHAGAVRAALAISPALAGVLVASALRLRRLRSPGGAARPASAEEGSWRS